VTEIKPFRAYIYNKKKIERIDKVIAPPYDVISKKQQNGYYRKDKYNIIRLMLGKIYFSDSANNNRYSRAAKFLNKWLSKNIIIQDDKESFYVYQQGYYKLNGKRRIKRLGFISLFKLQSFNQKTIFPHEHTLTKPKEDRFKLLKKTKTNFSPIFSLYSDKKGKIDKILKKALYRKPLLEAVDDNKTTHAIYKISDSDSINRIQNAMKEKRIFIADGHHRYETALKYRTFSKNKKGDSNKEYTMMYFTNLDNENLKIYPIHRLVSEIGSRQLDKLKETLKKYFDLRQLKNKNQLLSEINKNKPSNYKFGLYYDKSFYLVTAKSRNIVSQISAKKRPSYVDKLNVSLLHGLIIKRILKASDDKVSYYNDLNELIREVDKRRNSVAFFVPAIASSEIIKAALAGERLPRKSTYFYPKLYSGLVINKIDSL
jgi:uncharacterized protein (DUF1015 family)